MHSRIIQISKKPIDEDSLMDSSYYDCDHWFLNKMDYVDDACGDSVESRRSELKEWVGNMPGFVFDENELTITLESKEKYFEGRFKTFKETMDNLRTATLEDFAGRKLEMDVYMLGSLYEDEFSIYVDDNGEYHGLVPLDEWVHWADNGTKVYLGGIVDYHY